MNPTFCDDENNNKTTKENVLLSSTRLEINLHTCVCTFVYNQKNKIYSLFHCCPQSKFLSPTKLRNKKKTKN